MTDHSRSIEQPRDREPSEIRGDTLREAASIAAGMFYYGHRTTEEIITFLDTLAQANDDLLSRQSLAFWKDSKEQSQ